jgi:hypothetical protein
MSEADITINGQRLSEGQVMTVRVAIGDLASSLTVDGLGDDEVGKSICAGYLNCIQDIHRIMGLPPNA